MSKVKSQKSKVAIIDYGYGNLFSLEKALVHLGVEPIVTDNPANLADSSAIFLPGVGAFGDGIKELKKRGFEEPILKHVQAEKPLFGICLGMQFLFDESEEFGKHKGLGVIAGKVRRIETTDPKAKIPHIGWNKLFIPDTGKGWGDTCFEDVQEKEQVYFVHSYAGYPERKEDVFAETRYGGATLTAAVSKGNVVGTQFHPEKSGVVGLSILKQFLARVSQNCSRTL